MVEVRIAGAEDADGCVAVLDALPDFFTPDTHAQVAPALEQHRGWVALDGDAVVGFVIAEVRYPEAAEITFAAVLPDRRGGGIGTALVNEALGALARDGIKVVEVKTLDASWATSPMSPRVASGSARLPPDRLHDPLPGGNPATRQPSTSPR